LAYFSIGASLWTWPGRSSVILQVTFIVASANEEMGHIRMAGVNFCAKRTSPLPF
jgi:hypothetical protein